MQISGLEAHNLIFLNLASMIQWGKLRTVDKLRGDEVDSAKFQYKRMQDLW